MAKGNSKTYFKNFEQNKASFSKVISRSACDHDASTTVMRQTINKKKIKNKNIQKVKINQTVGNKINISDSPQSPRPRTHLQVTTTV